MERDGKGLIRDYREYLRAVGTVDLADGADGEPIVRVSILHHKVPFTVVTVRPSWGEFASRLWPHVPGSQYRGQFETALTVATKSIWEPTPQHYFIGLYDQYREDPVAAAERAIRELIVWE